MPPQQRTIASGELIPAIGYIRVSMLMEEQISPEIQRAAITDWARRNGRRIVRWIEDLDATGRNFRRKIMKAIEGIESGDAREIIVWKFNRFGRNRTGNAVNLGRVNLAGGELQSATEDVDARTAVGRLTRGMLMEIASFESDRIGEQWAETHAYRVASGLPANGRPRFGYVLRGRQPDPLHAHRTLRAPDDGPERYEPDPITGPVLADLYRRYIAGTGGQKLAAYLNQTGLRTTRGNHWSDVAIRGMLDRGFGAGLLRIHDPNCECNQPANCSNMTLIKGAHQPVISEEEWQAYRRRRLRVAATPPRARASIYPLAASLRCGHCGSRMTPCAEGPEPAVRYLCSGYLRKRTCLARSARRSAIEAIVVRELAQWADDIAAEAPVANEPSQATIQPERAKLEAEVAAADAAMDALTLKMAKGIIPEDSYIRARDVLLTERAVAAAALEEDDRPAPLQRHEYVPVIRTVVEEWLTLRPEARREMVADLLPEILIFRESRRSAWVTLRAAWGEERTFPI
ncbi:recombinase family protein [Sphaerisporangium album]|uniref:Recombinase family protein n=1 Tax=Sphaerisporangium album TaxID=509200 RepID=A0A367FBJ6_9ACTN|nr:recombinase family protein [Sphaerisporangium album]RCG27242.1 recombinase family protein [Sphaerisporangium album]